MVSTAYQPGGAACLGCGPLRKEAVLGDSGPLTGWGGGGDGGSCTWRGFCWEEALAEQDRLADPCPPADPSFIHAELIPDSAERNDDKLYFFFRERSAEAPQNPAVYARIGRICLVGVAGPMLPLSRRSSGSFSLSLPAVWG